MKASKELDGGPGISVGHFNKETFKNLAPVLGKKKYTVHAYHLLHQKNRSTNTFMSLLSGRLEFL